MKVRIYQDQPVPDSPGILVLSPTGDYAPFDFIECYLAGMPGQSYCAHQAQFVKFGSIVYREVEYINLLNQLGLVNIQPETLQDMLLKDQSTIVIDKDPQDIVTPTAVSAVVADVTVTAPANQYSTTTDEIIPPTTTTTDTVASSTQAVSLPIDTSTTTPVTIPDATSTPPLEGFSTTTVPILDASTTTSADPTAASTTDTTASTSTAAQVPASDSRLTAF